MKRNTLTLKKPISVMLNSCIEGKKNILSKGSKVLVEKHYKDYLANSGLISYTIVCEYNNDKIYIPCSMYLGDNNIRINCVENNDDFVNYWKDVFEEDFLIETILQY